MAVAQPYGFEIDFVRNPISGTAAWFFVIILKFIFTPILEIKVYVKKFLGTKKFIIEAQFYDWLWKKVKTHKKLISQILDYLNKKTS